ncbi:hypothetical protein O4H49_13395 [Kiloniella laminariae]|uniref:Protoheme IX farnesyltransferase n=1 Tax=Kiloniella laminariae TaxID=454162 RepID=A0ABT4LL04_9PROT|nr:hypothetical protein [Kiloniella laminariae]MCZ4281780.1 hypothetical protein [Kiloniella laminariae]
MDTNEMNQKVSHDEGATVTMTEEARRLQKRRNWAILGVLVAFIVLFYVITIVKMGLN